MLASRSSVYPTALCSSRSGRPAAPLVPQKVTRSGTHSSRRLQPLHALVLRPTGDGSFEHLDRPVDLPAEIVLTDGLQELGRDAPADVICPVPTVSTRHAMIRLEDGQVSITDLNSTNGTFVRFPEGDNEEELVPMRATVVPVGAEIIFGDQYLARFRLEDTSSQES